MQQNKITFKNFLSSNMIKYGHTSGTMSGISKNSNFPCIMVIILGVGPYWPHPTPLGLLFNSYQQQKTQLFRRPSNEHSYQV
jgi:hypothetical protein